MYQAKDVMTTNVVWVSPDASVDEAIRALVEQQVSGLPVVDAQGDLVGIISEYQLLELVYNPRIRAARVRDFMSRDVLSVRENMLLADVAGMFVMHRIRRVPVVRDGRIVGVITRRDLLRYMLDAGQAVDAYIDSLHSLAGPESAREPQPEWAEVSCTD